jgi:hypothetical protein
MRMMTPLRVPKGRIVSCKRRRRGGAKKLKTPVIVPRLLAEDFKKLTAKERSELQKTGKLSVYSIVESNKLEGMFKLIVMKGTADKNRKSPKAHRAEVAVGDDESITETIKAPEKLEGGK